ncbi:MAG: glycine cleavage system protein GcvH [Thaumarchaeota archaeon]|nr:glycine cleavage system protein GcvH [Nitrososphaerota archaeon]
MPKELLYTKEHEWARVEGAIIRVGITDYAAKSLNDVVYVTLPKPDERVEQLKAMGSVESIKAVSELYSPLSGTVTAVNSELLMHPELVNKSPYSEGWILELKPERLDTERKVLLDAKGYAAHLASINKDQPTSSQSP